MKVFSVLTTVQHVPRFFSKAMRKWHRDWVTTLEMVTEGMENRCSILNPTEQPQLRTHPRASADGQTSHFTHEPSLTT